MKTPSKPSFISCCLPSIGQQQQKPKTVNSNKVVPQHSFPIKAQSYEGSCATSNNNISQSANLQSSQQTLKQQSENSRENFIIYQQKQQEQVTKQSVTCGKTLRVLNSSQHLQNYNHLEKQRKICSSNLLKQQQQAEKQIQREISQLLEELKVSSDLNNSDNSVSISQSEEELQYLLIPLNTIVEDPVYSDYLKSDIKNIYQQTPGTDLTDDDQSNLNSLGSSCSQNFSYWQKKNTHIKRRNDQKEMKCEVSYDSDIVIFESPNISYAIDYNSQQFANHSDYMCDSLDLSHDIKRQTNIHQNK